MTTLTLTPHSNIRVEAWKTSVVLTCFDGTAVTILTLTPEQALALSDMVQRAALNIGNEKA